MSACRVTLTPFSDGAQIDKVLVRYELDDLTVAAGQELFRAQLNTVSGPGAEQLINSVNFGDEDSMNWFHRMMRRSGIIDELRRCGVSEGSTVSIEGIEFDFVE